MLKILNIGNETYQRHLILFEEQEIELKLKFLPTQEMWAMDVKYKDTQILNVKISINVLHIRNFNLPFDFIVIDNSGEDIDPFLKDDFKSNRCTLYLVEASEIENITIPIEVPFYRRVEVPIYDGGGGGSELPAAAYTDIDGKGFTDLLGNYYTNIQV